MPRIVKSQISPDFVFIGDDHRTPGIAGSVNDLLVSLSVQNTNCLFVELPADLSGVLNQAIAIQDINAFAKVVLDYQKSAIWRGFQRVSISDKDKEALKNYLATGYQKLPPQFILNLDTLKILNARSIKLIPFDANSESAEFAESMYLSVLMSGATKVTRELIIAARMAGNVRSHIMSRNIVVQSQANGCRRSLVVVGYAHLFTQKHFNTSYDANITISSIPELLAQAGFKSAVLIAHAVSVSTNTKIDFHNLDKSKFSDFVGSLITPPRG